MVPLMSPEPDLPCLPPLTPDRSATLLDAMSDPDWFGPIFSGPTWARWRVFLKALFGLPMTDDERTLYTQHTERPTPPSEPAREAWVIVGRRGGKSQIAALAAVWLALQDYSGSLSPGEVGTLPIIAADRNQARTVFRYIEGLIESVPVLRAMVAHKTKESIALSNRVVIEVHTSSFRAVRGYTLIGVVADEVAFWRSEDSANPDVEILTGLRPGMATIPNALLLCISTPYSRRGALWTAYRDHFGRDHDPVLVWQASTQTMNPSVDQRLIRQAFEDDEAAALAEYGGQFRSDVEVFLSEEVLARVVVPDRHELPAMRQARYVAFADPSGGSQDSFTLAIAHRDLTTGKIVLDRVCEARPPFNPSEVVESFSQVLRSYGVSKVTGDRYAGEWPVEAFRRNRITYEPSELTKSDLYLEALPLLTSGAVELPDAPRLLSQLRALERRTSRNGKDSVDHPPLGHDDLSNAAAGAIVLAGKRPISPGSGAALKYRVGRPRQDSGDRDPRLDDWIRYRRSLYDPDT